MIKRIVIRLANKLMKFINNNYFNLPEIEEENINLLFNLCDNYMKLYEEDTRF